MATWRKAFALSKAELNEAEPPGTVKLVDHTLERTISGSQHPEDHLRKVPQPCQSGLDPLNWPLWRKFAILFAMSFYAAVADMTSSIVAPALPVMAIELKRSFGELSRLVSVSVLLLGISNVIWVPLANVYGRRVVLVTASLIMTLGSLWCGLATSFPSLLAARAIQGLGGGPADTVAPDVLGEIFYIHQRGRALAVYTCFLAGGSFVGGIAGGYIAGRIGYEYVFWIPLALSGAVFLINLLLVPETLFDRKTQMEREQASQSHESLEASEKSHPAAVEEINGYGATSPRSTLTFGQSLKMGVNRGGLMRQFIAPYLTLRLPGVWVVMLHYAGLLGGIVTMSTVGPQFLAVPPYLWGDNVGLFNLAGVIGTGVGALLTYLVADRLLKSQATHQSRGFSEPESRLPGLFPALFVATAGFWVFGFSAANPSAHAWLGLCFGLGMIGVGLVQIPSIGFNYLIESYNAVSGDCFVMVTLLRAVISFAWTFFVGDWVVEAGAALPFGIFGMLMGVFSLLTIPLWLFGKRFRIATSQYLPTRSDH